MIEEEQKTQSEGAGEGIPVSAPGAQVSSEHAGKEARVRAKRGAGGKGKNEELFQELVSVNRVTKVVKGGKRFGFSALAVVGDRSGSAGYGSGKAKEVSKAVKKAMDQATRSMKRVPLKQGRTLHYDVKCSFGAALVQLRSAPAGTGVIAGGAMRAVFEAFGVQDVVSKSIKSSNSHSLVRATFKALNSVVPPRLLAQKRGKRVSDVFVSAKIPEKSASDMKGKQQ